MKDVHSSDGSLGMDVQRFKITQLNSGKYSIWSNDLEILLGGKGLWQYVDENAPPVSADGNAYDRISDLTL